MKAITMASPGLKLWSMVVAVDAMAPDEATAIVADSRIPRSVFIPSAPEAGFGARPLSGDDRYGLDH